MRISLLPEAAQAAGRFFAPRVLSGTAEVAGLAEILPDNFARTALLRWLVPVQASAALAANVLSGGAEPRLLFGGFSRRRWDEVRAIRDGKSRHLGFSTLEDSDAETMRQILSGIEVDPLAAVAKFRRDGRVERVAGGRVNAIRYCDTLDPLPGLAAFAGRIYHYPGSRVVLDVRPPFPCGVTWENAFEG
jgi:hypothetical protein